ncbi:MAG TPA: YfhO family protein [Actinomycetota bacterium]|nr:YfhO family protein [Actinomycetota bacterium]
MPEVIRQVAGPVLIVGSVLVVLHDIAFRGLLPTEQLDLLGFWLPTHCLLGTSLAGGHVPAWNPFAMGGMPFAADPQSGWMNLEAMLLYSTLPCDAAMRAYLVLQPIVCGLGLYWFLREEGLSWEAASVGGLSLGVGISGSMMVLSLPFSASFAWTAVGLATAARYARARDWPRRLLWLIALSAAWGQILASHASHGFIIGSAAVVAYLAARVVADRRRRELRGLQALLILALPLVAFPLVNLAFLLPRLAYLPRTTLGGGYEHLRALAKEVVPGSLGPPVAQRASPPQWMLKLSSAPGAYLGAGALALSFAGAWSRRHIHLVLGFAAYGLVFYVVSQQAVADAVGGLGSWVPFSDLLFHVPLRMSFAVLVAIPVLCAVGVDTWTRPGGALRRVGMVAPGVALWGVLPLVLGDPERAALFWAALLVAGCILVLSIRHAPMLALLPVAMAVELVASGLWGQGAGERLQVSWIEPRLQRPLTNFGEPSLKLAGYLEPARIARALAGEGSRYVSSTGNPPRRQAFLPLYQPEYWPLLENNRSLLFELESAHGYNPVQVLRFWLFIRAVEPTRIKYNVAALGNPGAAVLDLLDVAWVVGPSQAPPWKGLRPETSEDGWTLYRRPAAPGRVSLMRAWSVAASEDEALRRVVSDGFDPSELVVLEEAPGLTAPPAHSKEGTVAFRSVGPQAVRIVVNSSGNALVLVRTVHDPHWHATVDGRPVAILRADYLFLAVPVTEGSHVIELWYDDPWIGYGLAGSAAAVASVVVAALILSRVRRRSRRRSGEAGTTPEPVSATRSE